MRGILSLATLLSVAQVSAQSPVNVAYDSLLFTEDFFPLIRSRLDPIKFPGKVGGHVHLVVGSNAFTADETYESAQTGTCTTANLPIDMSSYWAPQLYYKWKNGSYSAVTGDGMTAYWKYPLVNTDLSKPFASIPDDFRMLAGDITRDDYDPADASNKAVEVLCVDANGSYDYTPYLPTDRECLTMRPQLHFPECWNGVDSYVNDNSHVAYPVDGNPEGGQCPEGYVKLPHLFMETTYHIKAENIGEGYEWYPGCFVFANGDVHGYSFHADWLNGFPSNFLVDAFNQCYDTATGLITKNCPFIEQNRGAVGNECQTVGDVVNEPVGQTYAIPALPGDNPEFNSSKHSDNYPKQTDPAYVDAASLVQASPETGGFCLAGVCTDYAGGGVASPQQPATGNQTVPGASSALAAGGTATSVGGGGAASSAVGGVATSIPGTGSSAAQQPPATNLGGDATMSILPVGSFAPVSDPAATATGSASIYTNPYLGGSSTGVPSASGSAQPSGPGGQVLVASPEDGGADHKSCARRKKRRLSHL